MSVFDEARGAAGEVHDVGLSRGSSAATSVGHPVVAVLALAGPDVVLAAQRGRHHLERRERPALLLVDELAAHLHPVVLDGELQLAAGVADLAGRADEDRVDRLAVPLLAACHDLAQVGVLAARRLALPAAAGVLLAGRHAVAAARAGVRHERDVAGDAVDVLRQVDQVAVGGLAALAIGRTSGSNAAAVPMMQVDHARCRAPCPGS